MKGLHTLRSVARFGFHAVKNATPLAATVRAQRAPRFAPALAGFFTQKVNMSSTSWADPKKLSDIVKLPLLRKLPPSEAANVWSEYHKEKEDAFGDVFLKAPYHKMIERGTITPTFVIPVPLPNNGFMTMVTQWHGNRLLVTFLEEYRRDPLHARPWCIVTFYDDLLVEKNMALARGECKDAQLSKKNAEWLWGKVKLFYLRDDWYESVKTFNKEPAEFNFNKHINYVLSMAKE
uniref:ATP synthase mitochondrial F1 complex assembly factor 1 n=1 Tax=Palpitomonas bilix TaxID=652834 RepID=A0A7S3GHE2_9EUKA|mmetsp:Transcript_49695/g.127809  ORF Transcript_49695/g.127809 Transcript_49695/m.127809 type:complete len:234 (+) Transcript_49695:40-741(+)